MSWSTSELLVRLVHCLTRLSPPVKYFYWPFEGGASFVDIFVISVLFCYAFMHICLLMPCGHLLGKGWPLGSHLWCLIVTLSLFHWYSGSGVVLDCIDSWFLPSFLLCPPIWDHCDVDVLPRIYNNRVLSISLILFEVGIQNFVWRDLGITECHIPSLGHCDLDLVSRIRIGSSAYLLYYLR